MTTTTTAKTAKKACMLKFSNYMIQTLTCRHIRAGASEINLVKILEIWNFQGISMGFLEVFKNYTTVTTKRWAHDEKMIWDKPKLGRLLKQLDQRLCDLAPVINDTGIGSKLDKEQAQRSYSNDGDRGGRILDTNGKIFLPHDICRRHI